MFSFKNKLTNILIISTFIGLGLFFILDNGAADADQTIDGEVAVSSALGNSGILEIKAYGVIAPLVGPNNTLFLFWRDKDSSSVYYNYYDGSAWSQRVQVVDPENNPIQASYGMAAAMVYPNDIPMACLFYKSSANASKAEGIVTPTCAELTYDENSKPVLSWKTTYAHRLNVSSVRTILSATESSDRNSIYLAWDTPNAIACDPADPSCDYENIPRIGKLHAYQCEVVNGSIVNINCGDTIMPDPNIPGDVPGFILPKDAYGDEVPFIFYAERYAAPDHIFYFNMLSGSPIPLENSSDNTRNTDERIDVDQLLTASGDTSYNYVYVAYKKRDHSMITFSKILTSNLLGFDQGYTRWTHCGDIGPSNEGPGLVSYNNALYVFFSDNMQQDKIRYIRIDQGC